MADETIEIIEGEETIEIVEIDETIEIIEGGDTIEIIENSVKDVSFVEAGEKIYLNGQGGDCYMMYNATDKRWEFYVEGILSGSFTKPGRGSDPFA